MPVSLLTELEEEAQKEIATVRQEKRRTLSRLQSWQQHVKNLQGAFSGTAATSSAKTEIPAKPPAEVITIADEADSDDDQPNFEDVALPDTAEELLQKAKIVPELLGVLQKAMEAKLSAVQLQEATEYRPFFLLDSRAHGFAIFYFMVLKGKVSFFFFFQLNYLQLQTDLVSTIG